MSFFTINNIRIAGLAVGVPKKTINNLQNPLFEPQEAESFVKNIGIENIRRAEGKSLSDLCLPIGKQLIEKLHWDRNEITLLILVSQSPDYKIPPTSLILQHGLGLPKSSMAFDINLGCSGYVYGLSVASSMMKATGQKKALLFVGDISSSCISAKDKSTAPVFSDAVSVTALELTDNKNQAFAFNLQSDGAGHEAIIIKDGGTRHPFSDESFTYNDYEKGVCRRNIDMTLNGIDVFNFSLREVAANVQDLLKNINKTLDDFDYLVMHQANLLMNESIRKKLKLDIQKVPYSLKDFGNTSCASIPVTLVHKLRNELNAKNVNLILSGFGVGLSWGSVALRTDGIKCLEIVEVD